MCGTFDNNCTTLHFGTVNILITTGTGLGQISAMGPGQRSSVMGKPDCPNTLSTKRLFTFSCPADVFCRMPDGEQGLQGHSKEALFECYLKPRRANDTNTQLTPTISIVLSAKDKKKKKKKESVLDLV